MEGKQVSASGREGRRNQKLKIVYLIKILLENTDENHGITLQEIVEKLNAYDVSAERKSLYDDIAQLQDYGYDIVKEQYNRNVYYKIVTRQFELAELKLLVDSVQSARFITAKKSDELIKKIENMASKYEASQLHRQVYMSGRIKTMNESIYYNVDEIHRAIAQNAKITFQYFNWTPDKKMELRHGGKRYQVSPWMLSWDDENYYMVAFDSEAQMVKHYRVDKMLHIEVTDEKREGKDHFRENDIAQYSRKRFGMFDGEEAMVKILCKNNLSGVMIDRFGKDVFMNRVDDEHFMVNVKVVVSRHFIAWIMALGEGVKVVGPDQVVEMIHAEIARLTRQYSE